MAGTSLSAGVRLLTESWRGYSSGAQDRLTSCTGRLDAFSSVSQRKEPNVMRSRISALLLGAILALSLAACSKKEQSQNPPATTDTSSQQAQSNQPAGGQMAPAQQQPAQQMAPAQNQQMAQQPAQQMAPPRARAASAPRLWWFLPAQALWFGWGALWIPRRPTTGTPSLVRWRVRSPSTVKLRFQPVQV